MIGKPEWFKYRIFGWGIAPKTWQGWVYVAVFAALLGFSLSISINNAVKPWIFGIIMIVFIIDVMHIMIQLPKVSDERENYHQLLIERNCSFAAIIALVAIAFWQSYERVGMLTQNSITFDISIAIVLGVMLLTKVVSTIYVKVKH